MAKTARIRKSGPYQESFAFRRPAPAKPPALRSRRKKGRIRRFLKRCLGTLSGLFLVFLVFAWSQGYAADWAKTAYDKFITATIEAGFALETVKTSGLEKTSEGAVFEALGVVPGESLFEMEMGLLEEKVEKLPWVRKAVVSRELPSTIKVLVSERVPYARWQIDGRIVLVDDTATVIPGAESSRYTKLPFIVGPGAPEAAPALLNLLATTPEVAAKVVAAVRVGQRRWDLEFDNGMRLKLPEKSETYGEAQAWEAFIELSLEKNLFALDVAECDLRLPDRIVMRLTPEGRAAFENNDQAT